MKRRQFLAVASTGIGLLVRQACAAPLPVQSEAIDRKNFDSINLSYPGLEQVRALYLAQRYDEAARELLAYYRSRNNVRSPVSPLDAATREKADKALLHQFQPQKGYGYYDYGRDIDWTYWPVRDNEVRWQLHRLSWWPAMGLAYRASGDEKYAREWVFQFRDWARKNPLGASPENDRYAWRPLEASERIDMFPSVFNLFLVSPGFTPLFLLEFLNSSSMQTEHVRMNYSDAGNHRLFEAQRVLGMGAFLPELKLADTWRDSGIGVLNHEIKKQVYDDGVQWELSPIYHVAVIEIFVKAYKAAKAAGMADQFPASYVKTVEKMVEATANMSFPDYSTPMFGDSWQVRKGDRIKLFQAWSGLFRDNAFISYVASEGKQGALPPYLSHASKDAGFYTFRNGWDQDATVMVLKASPPGEFHAQPDNGTFELWVRGRNFMPDSGCYVYSGDANVNSMRDWYRQSRVHNTLTLDNKNMVITQAACRKWQTAEALDVLTYSNPSYAGLSHQRSVLFVNKTFFLIVDQAAGGATGNLGVHFQLKEDSQPVFDQRQSSVHTAYADGNNLLIRSLNKDVHIQQEDGKVSYVYNHEMARPAFAFEKVKAGTATEHFVTIVYPFDGAAPPDITLKENPGNDFVNGVINVSIRIGAKEYEVASR